MAMGLFSDVRGTARRRLRKLPLPILLVKIPKRLDHRLIFLGAWRRALHGRRNKLVGRPVLMDLDVVRNHLGSHEQQPGVRNPEVAGRAKPSPRRRAHFAQLARVASHEDAPTECSGAGPPLRREFAEAVQETSGHATFWEGMFGRQPADGTDVVAPVDHRDRAHIRVPTHGFLLTTDSRSDRRRLCLGEASRGHGVLCAGPHATLA
jgi:hypothetical protein